MVTDAKTSKPRDREFIRIAIGYSLMIMFTVFIFLLIRHQGQALVAPPPTESQSPVGTSQPRDIFLPVLIALVAIILAGRILAKLFIRFGQPPVIGQVIAGILLGPSLLGPKLSAFILPASIAPSLGVIAQLGVVLYMFLVGLELNPELLKRRAHAVVATSHASILLPFLLGTLLALPLYPRLSSNNVQFTSFALFLGLAMSITAFPVLARILTDSRMAHTSLGVVALSCAAVDDVSAWCLLAFVSGVARAQMGGGLIVAVGALSYIAVMLFLVRPLLEWVTRLWGGEQPSTALVTFIFVALLLSALTAEVIGIHAIFGAFLLGVIIPHDSPVARALLYQLDGITSILLLPAFFALTGMRTRIDLLTDPIQWLICGLIILVATLGKFGGTFAAARLTGLDWRNAAMLGTLMNTRGLIELIVLNVGLELRVISSTMFAMMVLMAVVTTMLTSPILQFLKGSRDELGDAVQ